jgi:hypothetical protein
MVDPFRHESAGLIDRRFRVMDAVQRRTSTKGVHVDIPVGAQFPVRGHDRPLTPTPDHALISSHTTSRCESLASNREHNRARPAHQALDSGKCHCLDDPTRVLCGKSARQERPASMSAAVQSTACGPIAIRARISFATRPASSNGVRGQAVRLSPSGRACPARYRLACSAR